MDYLMHTTLTCWGNKLFSTALLIGGAENFGERGGVGCEELSDPPLPWASPDGCCCCCWLSCDWSSCDGFLSGAAAAAAEEDNATGGMGLAHFTHVFVRW